MDELIPGLKVLNHPGISSAEVAELFTELPAIIHAPRYETGHLQRLLPACGIGPLQPSGLGPIIVTPYSAGGGYIGQWCAEVEALQDSATSVEDGRTTGDLVYFGEDNSDKAYFDEALTKLGSKTVAQEYAALYLPFESVATIPEDKQGSDISTCPNYLEQLKLICPAAIDRYSPSLRQSCVKQKLTIGESLWAFYQFERAKFNPNRSVYPRELSGIMGGDGDFEREELAFGMLVEDREAGVYRIWSRAALCTK